MILVKRMKIIWMINNLRNMLGLIFQNKIFKKIMFQINLLTKKHIDIFKMFKN